jgi:resuscitation-promoting factor RpfB
VAVVARIAARRRAAPTPRQIAIRLLHKFHWGKRQFRYLNPLWAHESSWNVYALNAYSGAYGIPQAVPGSKMASAGRHWRTSARTQIRWGLRYIKDRYGSPAAAWRHELATGWY